MSPQPTDEPGRAKRAPARLGFNHLPPTVMQVDPRIYRLTAIHMGPRRLPLKLNGPKSEPLDCIATTTLVSYKSQPIGYIYGDPRPADEAHTQPTRLGRTGILVALDGAPLMDVPRSYVLGRIEQRLTWILHQYEKQAGQRVQGQLEPFQIVA